LLLCCLCEALAGADPSLTIPELEELASNGKSKKHFLVFGQREFSNIAWATAKLRVAPPSNVLPISSGNCEEMERELIAQSIQVRSLVLEVAKERASLSDPNERAQVPSRWIPAMSILAAKLLDNITCRANQVSPAHLHSFIIVNVHDLKLFIMHCSIWVSFFYDNLCCV
jgi:hypothetical protein